MTKRAKIHKMLTKYSKENKRARKASQRDYTRYLGGELRDNKSRRRLVAKAQLNTIRKWEKGELEWII